MFARQSFAYFLLSYLFAGFLPAQDLLFGEPNEISTELNGPVDTVTADMDGDGDLDVIAVYQYQGNVSWFRNDGEGGFSAGINIAVDLDGPNAIDSADFNDDGKPDFAVTAYNSNSLIVLKSNGTNESYFQSTISENLPGAVDVAIGDFDQDGYDDIFAASSLTDRVVQFPGSSSGTFGPYTTMTEEVNNIWCLKLADLDNDGQIEILAGSVWDNTLTLLQRVNGSIASSVIATDAFGVHEFEIVDLDGDGQKDIVAALTTFDEVVWFRNQGNLNFGFGILIADELNGPWALRVGDFNADGRNDIVCALINDNSVVFLMNNGLGGLFDSTYIEDFALDAFSVEVANINDDELADIIVASRGDDVLSWYEAANTVPITDFNVGDCWQNEFFNTTFTYFPETTFLWEFGDGSESGQSASVTHIYPNLGIYEVSLTACNLVGCDTKTKTINIERQVNTNIPTTALAGEEVLFQDLSLGFTNWTWLFEGEYAQTTQEATYVFDEAGIYSVELFVTDNAIQNCTYYIQEDIHVVGASTNLSPDVSSFEIPLITNPARDFINVSNLHHSTDFQIFGINGQLITQGTLAENVSMIDASLLREGLYFLVFRSDEGVSQHSVLISN